MAAKGLIGRGIQTAKIGLAARELKNSQTDEDRTRARRALAALFADAKGVTMKFGQLMAGGDDGAAFADLVSSIEPLGMDIIRPVVEAELGQPLDAVFDDFEASTHAASLGQVHRARLKDGTDVAVKVQYPDIRDAVDAEMRLFGLMPGVGPVKTWGFDLAGYKHALKENMDRELDYRNEAERQQRFRDAVQVPGLVVPRVHADLTTARILVQDWEDGEPLARAADWSQPQREVAGRILLQTLLVSIFQAGEIHGDPHAGNYAFRKTANGGVEVVLMDFGCTVPVERGRRLALLKMLIAVREDGALDPLDTFAAIGFDAEKLAAISGTLATLAHILLAPFKVDGRFFVHHWDLKSRFDGLLGENKWWFRAAGPPTQILLLRGFFGLAQQLDTLRAGLDWWVELNAALAPDVIAAARALDVPSVPADIKARAGHVATSLKLADHLRVLVTEGPNEIVSMAMPAQAVLRLDELIPEDVMAHLEESDEWDVAKILDGVRASGLEPQEILDFNKGPKHYRIWLE